MHKVEELEKKWFNYRLKKMVSPMVNLSLLSMVFGASYYFYTTKGNGLFNNMPFQDKITNVLGVSMDANASEIEKNIVSKKEIEVQEIVEKPLHTMALTPIIPVIDLEKEERISKTTRRSTPVVRKPVSSNTVRAKRNEYLTAKELAAITKTQHRVKSVPRETKKINFQSTSVNYIDTMKTKFAKSKSSRDALLIAKAYYKASKYSESEKWALSANKLNSSLEESWLMFAKSKVKLGKKQEAIKILASYFKKSQSVKAKDLIGQIKTGKI